MTGWLTAGTPSPQPSVLSALCPDIPGGEENGGGEGGVWGGLCL